MNEYVNAKQRNIVPPFKLEDDAAILSLKDKIELYRRTTGRDVVAVVKYQDFGCKVVAKKLGVKIE